MLFRNPVAAIKLCKKESERMMNPGWRLSWVEGRQGNEMGERKSYGQMEIIRKISAFVQDGGFTGTYRNISND